MSPPREVARGQGQRKNPCRKVKKKSLGQGRVPSPVARATDGLDPSVGDHASGVPTVGRVREPASQPASQPGQPGQVIHREDLHRQGLGGHAGRGSIRRGTAGFWDGTMRRSEFRWTPVGWSRFPLMCPQSNTPTTDGLRRRGGQTKLTWLRAQSEENNCNGLGACRPCTTKQAGFRVACRAPYHSPIPYSQTVHMYSQTVHTSMGRAGWQGRLCVGSFLSRVCSGITQMARAAAAPALALAPFLGSLLVVVGCGAGCRCRCRLLAGLAVAVMREDGFELLTCSKLVSHNTSTLPSPPSGTLRKSE